MAEIIHVDSDIRKHYPNTKTFTYRTLNGLNSWTSVNKTGIGYEKYVLNKIFTFWFTIKWHLTKFWFRIKN